MLTPGMHNLPFETWQRHHHSGVPMRWLWPAHTVLEVKRRSDGEPVVARERAAIIDYLRAYCVVPREDFEESGATLCPGCGQMLNAPGMLGSLLGTFEWGIAHGHGNCRARLFDDDGEDYVCGWPVTVYHKVHVDWQDDPLRFSAILPVHPWIVLDEIA